MTMTVPSIYAAPFGLLGRIGQYLDDEDAQARGFVPALDFADRGEHYEIRADLPGIRPEDVEIRVDQDRLCIRGERTAESESKDDAARYQRLERVFGRFERILRLPADSDAEQIEASGRDGVLRVRIGKQASAKPRRIAVQTH